MLTDLKLLKERDNSKHFFTPKFLVRYAPGSMRKETIGSKLDPFKAFSMNKLDNINNFEIEKIDIRAGNSNIYEKMLKKLDKF